MTIKAFNYDYGSNHDEIDVIVKSIPFLVNNAEVKVEENGTNGIAWFNFIYRVQNSDSKNTFGCSIDSVTITVTNPLPIATSCTWNTNVSIDKSIDQPLVKSSITATVTNPLPALSTCNASVPIHCSTDQPLGGSSVTTFVANPLPTSSTRIASVPVDNSTDQPLAVSSSSLWALIGVTITLLISLFVIIIIAMCIVKIMSVKRKETKERNARDHDGKHTCPILVHVLSYC